MSKKSELEAEKAEARERLLKLLPPGTTVYVLLRHVSSSGMTRCIDVLTMENGQPRSISFAVGRLLDLRHHRKYDGLVVEGCGMDMGFSVVYNLSQTLYPDGFQCIGKDCRSNDHSNGDRDRTPHKHSSGGYALYHHWL